MPLKKFKDWRGWLDGLRSKAMKAGAESISTNLGALLTTNGVANLGIEAVADIGMNWKTAVATMLIQFGIRTGFAAAQYVAAKPDPDIIEVQSDTETINKSDLGQ